MKQLLISLMLVTCLNCSQEEQVSARQSIPVNQIEWQDESSWIPAHDGNLPDESGNDSLVFVATGWSSQDPLAALVVFFRESQEKVSSIPVDRMERILMNIMAGQEPSSALPDPRIFVGASSSDTIWLQQFLPVTVNQVGPKKGWSIGMRTEYPREGEIEVELNGPAPTEWTVAFRQPGWTNNAPDPVARYRWRTNRKLTVELEGEYIFPELIDGYAYITRVWNPGDVLKISFPMSVRRLIFPGNDGEERMSMEVGPVVLATKKDPEASETLPDQGYLQQRENSDGVSVWDWTVDGVRYEFFRLPELGKPSEVMIDWSYQTTTPQ